MTRVSFSPVTRVSGLLSVDLQVDGGRVTDARTIGGQFRGFEFMLRGRSVDDAVYFTSRICGICSTVHAYTAARLLEDLFGLSPPPNGVRLRQAALAAEFLQNHLRHFYLLGLPDFLPRPGASAPAPARFSPAERDRLARHLEEAVVASRKCHDLLSVFGGKVPHQHGIVKGGVTARPTADALRQSRALLAEVRSFVGGALLPDAHLLAERYPEYFQIGLRPASFLTFGLFSPDFGPFVPAGAVLDGRPEPFDPSAISETATCAWYSESAPGEDEPCPDKPGAYTWVKSPRYKGFPVEGGPVARQTLLGRRPPVPARTMDRILARADEAALFAEWAALWLDGVEPGEPVLTVPDRPPGPFAQALNDACRGPLLHHLTQTGGVIDRYTVITPTTWNFSPRDSSGRRGPAEEALVGTELADPARPEIEAGRIVRAFDPCLSCATHVVELDTGRSRRFVS